MRKIILFVLSVLAVAAFPGTGIAGVYFENCQMCHGLDKKSSVAKLTKAGLLKKYKTRDQLVAGAKATKDPDMEEVRCDAELLASAAADIGLK